MFTVTEHYYLLLGLDGNWNSATFHSELLSENTIEIFIKYSYKYPLNQPQIECCGEMIDRLDRYWYCMV